MLYNPVRLNRSCPKNYLSFRMSQGNLNRLVISFRWPFRLILLSTLMGLVEGVVAVLISLENPR